MKILLLPICLIGLTLFLNGCTCPELDCSKCAVTEHIEDSREEAPIVKEPAVTTQDNDNENDLFSAISAILRSKDLDEIFAFENRPDDARWKSEYAEPYDESRDYGKGPGVKSHFSHEVFINFYNTRTLEEIYKRIDMDVIEYYYVDVAKQQFEDISYFDYACNEESDRETHCLNKESPQTETIADTSYVVTYHNGPTEINNEIIEENVIRIYFRNNNLNCMVTYYTRDLDEDFVSTGVRLAKKMVSKATS